MTVRCIIAAGCFVQKPQVIAQIPQNTPPIGASHSVANLPGGVQVNSVGPNRHWNCLLLLATPKINSGDVGKLSDTMRQAATHLSLTIMAAVKAKADGSGYELDQLGVGYSVPISGKQTTITYATQSSLGADLGFIQRRVLSQNELRLADLKKIVDATTLVIFDAPGLMHRDGKHRDYTTRHMVWIDTKTGDGVMLAWLLGKNANGQLRPANEPLRIVASGTKEQRNVHVDGDEFAFGFPAERAFALEELPPGKDLAWTQELASVAALPSYNAAELGRLSTAINNAIRANQSTP